MMDGEAIVASADDVALKLGEQSLSFSGRLHVTPFRLLWVPALQHQHQSCFVLVSMVRSSTLHSGFMFFSHASMEVVVAADNSPAAAVRITEECVLQLFCGTAST